MDHQGSSTGESDSSSRVHWARTRRLTPVPAEYGESGVRYDRFTHKGVEVGRAPLKSADLHAGTEFVKATTAMMVGGVDATALSSTPVTLLDGGTQISRGSGFLFAHPNPGGGFVISLVTNYHVVTGAAPRRRRKPVGDSIGFELRIGGASAVKVTSARLPLRTMDGKPTWIQCPTFPDADVVVVPLPLDQAMFETAPYCLDQATVDFDTVAYVGQQVGIVGYPLGISDRTNKLPIWKTGHIASEPGLDFDSDPKFLVDVTGRLGMSGSPVLAGHMHPYYTSSGMMRFGSSGRLLGVYTSNLVRQDSTEANREELSVEELIGDRLPESHYRPELGVVWKARLISETLTNLNIERHRSEIWSKLPEG